MADSNQTTVLSAQKIVNRLMAGALMALLAPLLAKANLHLSPEEYGVLAAALGVIGTNAYHWFEARAAAAGQSQPRLSGTDLVAIVRVVLAEVLKQQSAAGGAPANPTPVSPARPASSQGVQP